MEPINQFSSVGVPIDIANCDTDQLFPARYLRVSVDDPNYASFLLHDLRFNADGTPKDFIYNKPPFNAGGVFVGDVNWGCGSSREAAVTVLMLNGVRVVIAPSFGDIHYTNCVQNGVVPVRLPIAVCDAMRHQLHQSPGAEVTLNLKDQTVVGPDAAVHAFDINSFDKQRLLKGLDDIGLTMEFSETIDSFVTDYRQRHRWAVVD